MPRGRMQHTAALPQRQKLLGICRQYDHVHMKKNFLQTFFRLPKLWNEIGELGLIFFSKWLIPFWKPLLIICHAASFDGTDNLLIEFLGRAASNGRSQPSARNIHIYLWHGATFAALCCFVPRGIVWTYLKMTPDRSHSDTVGRVANKVRVEGGLTSSVQNIALLTHFLRQRFFLPFSFHLFVSSWNRESKQLNNIKWCYIPWTTAG